MASFLRGKQAGIQNDLSGGILPGSFAPDEQSRYGINSQVSCLAYEPVQSLLAVGANESKFGPGNIYVFGRSRVHKFFTPPRPTSFRQLHFVANRLVSLDARNDVAIWDLDTAKQLAHYTYPGASCLATDPMLDWALIGLHNGDIFAYDLDRERPSPFRIPHFWQERDPRARDVALVGMQLHPKDIGRLLIAYNYGAVIYSFKQNLPVKFFEYQLPPGAPGGNSEGIGSLRKPRLTHAVWHPSGTFILTSHEDGSLVFWDAKDGRLITARSIYATKVNEPGSRPSEPTPVAPITKISWCCKENPDDTALLIAGGQALDDPEQGMTFIELGLTPIYATSSWEILAAHFGGKRRLTLQTPPGAKVLNYCLIPRTSPHFAGTQDPIAVLTMLTSGELITLSFPSGFPISPTNMLHPSLSFVHPFVQKVAVATVARGRWLGMVEKRNQGDVILKGGAEAAKRRRRYEARNIIQVAHADSTVRMWDVGHADEIENPAQLQVDIARAVNRYQDVEITAMDMAETTGEFAAGTIAGEVVIYRWGGNKYFGRDEPKSMDPNPGGISDISSRAEPTLKEGLQPFVLYEMMQGPITVVSVSDVGFVAVGSENGFISIIDLRGPAVILQMSTAELTKHEKKSLFKGHSSSSGSKEWPVVIEFGVMTLEGDNYSSIACFVGTNLGHVATFKLLPSGQGYSAKLAGVVNLSDKIIAICPINADTGHAAAATGPVVASLREGQQVNGTLVVVTQTEARIFKPATAKGASKSFDGAVCDAASVTELELFPGFALVAVFNDRTARAYSLPGLKELGRKTLPMLDASRTASAIVARTGDVFGWTGPSELVILPVWGTGKGLENSLDTIVNPELLSPPRPTISNLQWISGTQYVSPTDLDLLIGGGDRPPSKRMLAAAAEEQRSARAGGGGGGAAAGGSQEGWGEYLTRQLNERTEKLNMMGDSMDNLQASSQGWADDVGKFVKQQKRGLLLGGIKKSLF
ncbi:lethal giant larvae like, C-terminal-domain-containing protein [Podospora appendiculata]|uniref:Lethal giant larvae like, C-terminal-domain-containing protein n=1 Tax=Podospora appendiculata TaxID=314037 RepID=A0AAE0XBJ4_9PEZI|nr:lethal giant larvae like, C-terminal-domain-containing protein [Podospora appendiculata]